MISYLSTGDRILDVCKMMILTAIEFFTLNIQLENLNAGCLVLQKPSRSNFINLFYRPEMEVNISVT